MTNPLNLKKAVQDWGQEQFETKIKQPIASHTEKLENQVSQYWIDYSAKAQAYNPANYYKKQDAFYRGLFWIAVVILIILWMLSSN